jgi:uncharacterized protein HemX
MTDTPSKDDPAAAPRPPAADQEWASLAASLGAGNAVRAVPGAEPPRGVQRAVLSSTVALLFAFVAIMIAGMLWWQYRQFYVSLDQTDTAAAEALARVRAEQRALQDNLADANDDVDTLRQLNTSLGERLDALPGRFVALEERLDAVQGGSFDARGTLLRSEAEYYLTVANTELTLAGDYESAVTALELARYRGDRVRPRAARRARRRFAVACRSATAPCERNGRDARRRARLRQAVARDQGHVARSRARRAA